MHCLQVCDFSICFPSNLKFAFKIYGLKYLLRVSYLKGIVAKIAKELGILTLGAVTVPFHFEAKPEKKTAEKGI